MTKSAILKAAEEFTRQQLDGAEAGHDWWHVVRVRRTAKYICQKEGGDRFTVELAALLHDIGDSKFHGGDEEVGPRQVEHFLDSIQLDAKIKKHVLDIVKHISFRKSLEGQVFSSKELSILQDADRLDAIGAIGIARAFSFGGFKNREFFNPLVKPQKELTAKAYKQRKSPTINHFYEKLLLLKDQMNTATGKQLAQDRHRFMEAYLEQFYREWHGKS